MSSTKKFRHNKKITPVDTPKIDIVTGIDPSTIIGEITEGSKKPNKTLKSAFNSLFKHDVSGPKELRGCFNGGMAVVVKLNKQKKNAPNNSTTGDVKVVDKPTTTLKSFIKNNISMDNSNRDKFNGSLKIESRPSRGGKSDNYVCAKEKSITTKKSQSTFGKPLKQGGFSNKKSKPFGSEPVKPNKFVVGDACVVCGHRPTNNPPSNKTSDNSHKKKTKHNSKHLLKGNEKTCKVVGGFFENNSKTDSKSTKVAKGAEHNLFKVSAESAKKLKNKTSGYLGTKKNKKKTTPTLIPQDNTLVKNNLRNNHKPQTQGNLTFNNVKKKTANCATNADNVADITKPISRRHAYLNILKTSVSPAITTVEKKRNYNSRISSSKSNFKTPSMTYRKEASAPTLIKNGGNFSYNQTWHNLFRKAAKVRLRIRLNTIGRHVRINKGGSTLNTCSFKSSVIDRLRSTNSQLPAILPNRVPFFQSNSPDKKLRGWLYSDSYDWAAKKQSTMVSFSRGPMARKKQSIVTLKDRDLLLTAPLCHKVSETILLGNSNRPYFVFGGESSPSSAPSAYSALVDLSTLV